MTMRREAAMGCGALSGSAGGSLCCSPVPPGMTTARPQIPQIPQRLRIESWVGAEA